MSRTAFAVMALLVIPGLCWTEAQLAVGTQGTLQQPGVPGLDAHIEASASGVAALSESLSLLAEASARASGILPEKILTGFAYGSASLSNGLTGCSGGLESSALPRETRARPASGAWARMAT